MRVYNAQDLELARRVMRARGCKTRSYSQNHQLGGQMAQRRTNAIVQEHRTGPDTRGPAPPGGTDTNPRERWDLFNLGVAMYSLPLNVTLMFQQARADAVDPIRTNLGRVVLTEACAVRESGDRLAPYDLAADSFQEAVDHLLAGPDAQAPDAWAATRERFLLATPGVVGFLQPRQPWFRFGIAIGQWRQRHLDHLDALVETNAGMGPAEQPADVADLYRGYAAPPFAPIFLAGAGIPPGDTAGITPLRNAAAVWNAGQKEASLSKHLRGCTAADDFDEHPPLLDRRAVDGFETAVTLHLAALAGGAPLRPSWDCKRGELRVAGLLAKRIVVLRADNVRALLDSFEGNGWPDWIVTPTAAGSGTNGRRVLRNPQFTDTVKSLNDGLEGLKFRVHNGGVCWERRDAGA